MLSTLNTLDAQQAVERFVGAFSAAEQASIRERLTKMLRYVVSQRLVPRDHDGGRVAVFEVLKSGSKILDQLLRNGTRARAGAVDANGLDTEIEKLVRAGIVSPEIALAHAIDPHELSKRLVAAEK